MQSTIYTRRLCHSSPRRYGTWRSSRYDYIQADEDAYSDRPIRTHSHIHTDTQTKRPHIYTHTDTCTHTHTYSYTHTHRYTDTYMQAYTAIHIYRSGCHTSFMGFIQTRPLPRARGQKTPRPKKNKRIKKSRRRKKRMRLQWRKIDRYRPTEDGNTVVYFGKVHNASMYR